MNITLQDIASLTAITALLFVLWAYLPMIGGML